VIVTFTRRDIKYCSCWALWYTTIIPAFGRLRLEDSKFKASLGYILRLSQKTNKLKQNKNKASHNLHTKS
jgi:hypothetical protein